MAREAEGAVTSFRWSVLPQDAERLCVQELARSPSSSCQDRGVCRERNPRETEQLLRQAPGKQPHHCLDGGGGSWKASLSSVHQPPTCPASSPIHVLREAFPDAPGRPTVSLFPYEVYTWMCSGGSPWLRTSTAPPHPNQLRKNRGLGNHWHPRALDPLWVRHGENVSSGPPSSNSDQSRDFWVARFLKLVV